MWMGPNEYEPNNIMDSVDSGSVAVEPNQRHANDSLWFESILSLPGATTNKLRAAFKIRENTRQLVQVPIVS